MTVSNMYLSSKLKNAVINLLLENPNFVEVVNPKPSECEELDLMDVMVGGDFYVDGKKIHEDGYIYDYNFVTDITEDKRTYTFVETACQHVQKNVYVDMDLYICVFAEKSIIRLDENSVPNTKRVNEMGYFCGRFGNRIDVLLDIVDGLVNGNPKLGVTMDVVPAGSDHITVFQPSYHYYGKVLKYRVRMYNETNGVACGL